MTTDEARELLPLYVAGSLDIATSRSIEAHLAANADLRDDLRFWRAIAHNTRELADPQSDGHVDSSVLVRYAESPASVSKAEKPELDEHLRACPDCRSDFAKLKQSKKPDSRIANWKFAAAAAIVLAALATLLTIQSRIDSTPPDTRVVIARVPYFEYYRSTVPDTTQLVTVHIFPKTDSVTLQVEVPLPHQRAFPLRWSMRAPGQGWVEYDGAFQGRTDPNGYYIEWQEFGESTFPVSGRFSLKAQSQQDGDFYYDIEVVRH